jgi:hypothetical protein
MGLSLSLERDHEGRIREVLQEDCCSSMYCNYYAFAALYLYVFTYHVAIPASGNLICKTDRCLFFVG